MPGRAGVGWLVAAALAAAILANAVNALSDAALDRVGIASFAWAGFRLFSQLSARAWIAGVSAVALGGMLVLLQAAFPAIRYVPWLLIGPANLVIAWIFVRGLLPGREPVLLGLIVLMGLGPVDDSRFRRFVAGQCLLWGLLALATGGAALSAAVSGAARPWVSEALTAFIVVQIVWFMLSHQYAAIRYGRRETWWRTARAMARPETWSRLHAR